MRHFLYLILFAFLLNVSSCARRVATTSENVTIIKTAPRNYKIVRVNGKRYYFWNGNHYRRTRKGYVLVRL
ncbi:MAG: DUF6515 family protein [Bacteroidota bacterium]